MTGERGRLITFEGGEGAGKSTQIERLTGPLRDRGHTPITVREPGGTATGERVRDVLLDPDDGPTSARAEVLLYLAARAELTERVIRPALEAGRIVICDRFIDASVAYQGGGRDLGVDVVTSLNRFATADLVPDLTFLLDLDPEVGLCRAADRSQPDRLERETLAFHRRVRDAYRALGRDPRFVMLDATEGADRLAETILTRTLALLDRA